MNSAVRVGQKRMVAGRGVTPRVVDTMTIDASNTPGEAMTVGGNRVDFGTKLSS